MQAMQFIELFVILESGRLLGLPITAPPPLQPRMNNRAAASHAFFAQPKIDLLKSLALMQYQVEQTHGICEI